MPDGRGGTRLSFTTTLFPPIGSGSATSGYSATIEDGVVPRIEATVLPVNPLESPSFKTAATSYQGGSDTGSELSAGATEIDANLLRLRAGELLAGLPQLHAGAEELQAGLAGEAAPGARRLAEGGDELPAAKEGVGELKSGIDRILAGFGAVGQADTLIDGLNRLETGLGQLGGGLRVLRGDGSDETPDLVRATGGVDQVQQGLAEAVKPGGSPDQLIGGLNLHKTLDCGPICQGAVDTQILTGVQDSKNKLTLANGGLLQVSAGLGNAIAGVLRLSSGASEAADGAPQLVDGAAASRRRGPG